MKNTENTKEGRSSFIVQYTVIIGVIVVLTNLFMGLLLMFQSTTTIREMVRKSMLNVATTAADLLNGDELGALAEESVGGEEYKRVYSALSAFRDNANIEYIYAVREEGEGNFVFTVDVDPENPADFGEEVLVTKALLQASDGTASVDDAPAQDEWGNFYSAYSPVFDSYGNVAGIVGVDYNSEWYDRQLREHTFSIGLVTLISVLVIGALVFSMTDRIRKRFAHLNEELSLLSDDVDRLSEEITSSRDYRESQIDRPATVKDVDEGDQIEQLSRQIHAMHSNLSLYLAYEQAKARTDGLTGIGNSTAYIERQDAMEEQIKAKTAEFAVVIYDIDFLKTVNDRYGHKCGDRIITGAAEAIRSVFGVQQTFRIGGDEFAVIAEHTTEPVLQEQLKQVEAAAERFNEQNPELGAKLSLSCGEAFFDPSADTSFHDVFIRADEEMYRRKGRHHQEAESH